jgi:hypothetical protein
MKEFRKTSEGLFICEECGKNCKKLKGLIIHIRLSHNKAYKEYFDKWLKEEGEGLCKICGKETIFTGFKKFYKSGCCRKHMNQWNWTHVKQLNLEKHGVENNFQRKECKEKTKQTKKEKYGDENFLNVEKAKQTCLKNHGVENPLQSKEIRNKGKETKRKLYGNENYNNREKTKQTCQEKWSVDNVFQVEEYKEKCRQTCLKNYEVENVFQSEKIKEKIKEICREKFGTEHPMQNKEIFEKQLKSALKFKRFRDTDLWYQGSYELDFLEKYYSTYTIERGPSIKYIFKNEDKVYHSDFYISSLNLVVEIKSTWTYDPIIDPIKEKAVIDNDFNFIMIINKDYAEFKKIIFLMCNQLL